MQYAVNGKYDDFEDIWTYTSNKPAKVLYSSENYPDAVWGLNLRCIAIRNGKEKQVPLCVMHCTNAGSYMSILESIEIKCDNQLFKKELKQGDGSFTNSTCFFDEVELNELINSEIFRVRIRYPEEMINLKMEEANKIKNLLLEFYNCIYKPESPLFNSEEKIEETMDLKKETQEKDGSKEDSKYIYILVLILVAVIWNFSPSVGLLSLIGLVIYIFKNSIK